jgi:hypothetical protein
VVAAHQADDFAVAPTAWECSLVSRCTAISWLVPGHKPVVTSYFPTLRSGSFCANRPGTRIAPGGIPALAPVEKLKFGRFLSPAAIHQALLVKMARSGRRYRIETVPAAKDAAYSSHQKLPRWINRLFREGCNMRPRLRLFTGDGESTAIAEPQVSVRLGEITRVLADAFRSNRRWLNDFADDEVQISEDLYEVLSAYWHLRPSA